MNEQRKREIAREVISGIRWELGEALGGEGCLKEAYESCETDEEYAFAKEVAGEVLRRLEETGVDAWIPKVAP